MKLNDLRPVSGSHKDRKRVGRGHGSGRGKTAGRGTKGQKSRSGNNIPPRFEGGQTPISQRLPYKRGFTNIFKVEYQLVRLSQLNSFESGQEIDAISLRSAGIINSIEKPVKVLANGEINKSLHVKVDKFSAAAKQKIEAAGGKIIELKVSQKTEES